MRRPDKDGIIKSKAQPLKPAEPLKINWEVMRPGALDHLKIPSLHCGRRLYRDGRVEVAK
jgi:hypothetical protein